MRVGLLNSFRLLTQRRHSKLKNIEFHNYIFALLYANCFILNVWMSKDNVSSFLSERCIKFVFIGWMKWKRTRKEPIPTQTRNPLELGNLFGQTKINLNFKRYFKTKTRGNASNKRKSFAFSRNSQEKISTWAFEHTSESSLRYFKTQGFLIRKLFYTYMCTF